MKSLEFYSGIGGMHYACKGLSQKVDVIAAFDINTTANVIYEYNFGEGILLQRNIDGITSKELDKFGADLWTMSPPCQPFTRKGLKLGSEDHRTDSFFNLINQLSQMNVRPTHILIENVVGFEESSVHDSVLVILHELGYNSKEFILSPTQFGIPNSRPRYYLLAKRGDSTFQTSKLSFSPPRNEIPPVALQNYLDSGAPFGIDEALIMKYGKGMHVVSAHSTSSACFTKSYGTYVNGCGSFVCSDPKLIAESSNRLTIEALSDSKATAKCLRIMKPREVANLMCFPEDFYQPPDSTDKQMYKTLGNSVNVHAISSLLEYLIQ